MSPRFWIACGALLAATAVAAGAVGTHLLKERFQLSESQLETYDVAVRYHMVHALGLILVGILASRRKSGWLTAGGSAMLLGILLFSGGIYARIWTDLQPIVPVVPVGGTAWILGWLLVSAGALREPRDKA